MNIKKHGCNPKEEQQTEEFKCEQCGCEFAAGYDEYYVERGSAWSGNYSGFSYTYSSYVTDKYICSCPECNKIVIKEKQRVVETPSISVTGLSDKNFFTSEACKGCSNNPANGGSGNCNCTLGGPTITAHM